MHTELKQFYEISQTYLRRLEKHDYNTFAPYIELCEAKIPASALILDCGCGIGTSSYLLAKKGFKVTALDLSSLFISEARKKYVDYKNLKFMTGDISKMPYPNNSFDAVCCYDTLEHVTDVKKCLEEMSRVLKTEGLLIIFMPNHLDPLQHLIKSIRWKTKDYYKPWEAKSRIEAFWQFIRTTYLSLTKAIGINKKVYYLRPVLSDDENVCGEDFDATWLTNWFDVENDLKKLGYSFECIIPKHFEDRIMRMMITLKLPKILQVFYAKLTSTCVIVGRKE